MAIAINGSSNTITGIAVGGLPDGIVDTDMLAANAVNIAKLGSTTGKNGPILQIIQGSTESEVTTSSTTYVDSGLSQAITTTGSNKVLVIISQQYRLFRNATQALGGFRILRGSTAIQQGPNGGSENAPFGIGVINNTNDNYVYDRYTVTYLDSPSAGTHTYKTQMAITTTQDSAQIRAQYNASSGANGASFITLMEVSA